MIAGDERLSQVPGEPLCMRAPLFDPGGSDRSRHRASGPMLPSRFLTPSTTTRTVLSRLHHAAHMLAVYASRRGSPQRRARLAPSPLARRSLGRTYTCWVPLSHFKAASQPPLPTSQTLPGAPETYGLALTLGETMYYKKAVRVSVPPTPVVPATPAPGAGCVAQQPGPPRARVGPWLLETHRH